MEDRKRGRGDFFRDYYPGTQRLMQGDQKGRAGQDISNRRWTLAGMENPNPYFVPGIIPGAYSLHGVDGEQVWNTLNPPRLKFYPAFGAKAPDGTDGIIVAYWDDLISKEWAEYTDIGRYEKYYVVPLVLVDDATQWTTIDKSGVKVAYEGTYVQSTHNVLGVDRLCEDYTWAINDTLSVGFDNLFLSFPISGSCNNTIVWDGEVFHYDTVHNMGVYWGTDNRAFPPNDYPRLINFLIGGKKSKLTNRAILLITEGNEINLDYCTYYDHLCTITVLDNVQRIIQNIYIGKTSLRKKLDYLGEVSFIATPELETPRVFSGNFLIGVVSDIHFLPNSMKFIKDMKGSRFNSLESYKNYNQGEKESLEVAYIALTKYDIVYNPRPRTTYHAFSPILSASLPYGYLYAISYGKDEANKFTSRYIPSTEKFEDKYTYLKQMYVVAKQ